MNNLVKQNNETLAIFDDASIGTQYTSFSPDSIEGKMTLYNAINSPDNRIADFINTPIMLRDVVISIVKLTKKRNDKEEPTPFDEGGYAHDNENTERLGFRVILIDVDGVSYTATSTGVYNSVKTLRSVFGTLHFEDGLKMLVKQIKTKNGNILTLSLK